MVYAAFAIRADDYEAVVTFYIAVFGAVGIAPETVEDQIQTTGFQRRLYIRDEQPGTVNADVIVSVATEQSVRDVLNAVRSDVEPEEIGGDGEPRQYRAMISDPGGNAVWIVFNRPSFAD